MAKNVTTLASVFFCTFTNIISSDCELTQTRTSQHKERERDLRNIYYRALLNLDLQNIYKLIFLAPCVLRAFSFLFLANRRATDPRVQSNVKKIDVEPIYGKFVKRFPHFLWADSDREKKRLRWPNWAYFQHLLWANKQHTNNLVEFLRHSTRQDESPCLWWWSWWIYLLALIGKRFSELGSGGSLLLCTFANRASFLTLSK